MAKSKTPLPITIAKYGLMGIGVWALFIGLGMSGLMGPSRP